MVSVPTIALLPLEALRVHIVDSLPLASWGLLYNNDANVTAEVITITIILNVFDYDYSEKIG